MSDDRSPEAGKEFSASPETRTLAEAERLARRLPVELLLKTLRHVTALYERPGSGKLTIEKSAAGKVHMRGHGNEWAYDEYEE